MQYLFQKGASTRKREGEKWGSTNRPPAVWAKAVVKKEGELDMNASIQWIEHSTLPEANYIWYKNDWAGDHDLRACSHSDHK